MNHKELAKLITLLENNPDEGRKVLKRLPKGRAKVIGFTGSPGVGKSCAVDQLTRVARERNKKVAIIAVDPSSPFSNGAFLGDRIRMRRHFLDNSVFIRSMATRGALGGLNKAVFDTVEAFEAYGFDYVFIETVGIGQSETDILYVADVVVLVLAPGFGDEIQMFKAGIMEIADLYVINKSDLAESDLLYGKLQAFLSSVENKQKIVKISALNGFNIESLFSEIEDTWNTLEHSGKLVQKRKIRVQKHASQIIGELVEKTLPHIEGNSAEEIAMKLLERICSKKIT